MSVPHLAQPHSSRLPIAAEPRRPKRRWGWLLLPLAAAGAAAYVYVSKQDGDPLAGVELVTVRRAEIEDAVTALGKIQPRDYVDVGAQVSGQLEKLAVKVGDHVEAGALLAEIDPRLQVAKLELDRAQLAQLEAERDVQKLQAAFASSQLDRQTRMLEDRATRTDTFERVKSEAQVASAKLLAIDAQIKQIRSTLKADEAQLSYTRIFAPITGTVVSLDARLGQTLIAAQQAPLLLRIADLSTMTVWAQVSEADITRLHPGMDLYFTTLGAPENKRTSKLRQLLPAPPKAAPSLMGTNVSQVSNNVVLYTALFDVENAEQELLPEMSAQIFFVAARADNALIIPTNAVHAGDAAKGSVNVVNKTGQLEARDVTLGIRNRFDVQVLSGLEEGERVAQAAPEKDDDGDDK